MSSLSAAGPKIIIVMGVAGAGKSTVGRLLADRLGWSFLDADDFHPESNVAKMRRGIPLTDADRESWLERLRATIESHLRDGEPAVLACSALKASYREKLTKYHEGVAVVYLRASRKLVEERLRVRSGHFFNAALIESQYDALEEPDSAIVVDASRGAGQIVADITSRIADE